MDDQEHIAQTAIRQLLATCTQAGDARKADAYAACYTPDGVLELAEAIRGRDAIRQWMSVPTAFQRAAPDKLGYVSHHLTTCRIDMTSEFTATGRTYWLVITPVGLDHSGYYDDRFRKEGDHWLIAHRRPRTLWFAQDSAVD